MTPMPDTPNFRDMTGRRVGDVNVLSYEGASTGSQRGAKWRCRCAVCGAEFLAITQKLKRGCFQCLNLQRKKG